MEDVNQPSPALYTATLRVLHGADPRSRSMVSTLTNLVDQLTETEAECFPQALGGVLPLLKGDPERLRFVADIAVRLDFYEVTDTLADLAETTRDRELLLSAATLCGNPAVERSVRARVSHLFGDDPAGRIRFDPDTVPATADEERLYLQCWPGARRRKTRFALAPVVVLDEGLGARMTLRLALRLKRARAVVRRLAQDSEVPFWFGAHTVLLCQQQTGLRVRDRSDFPERHILTEDLPENERQIGALFRKINTFFPSSKGLRLTEFAPEISTNLWDPAVFSAGVYQTKEAAFLSGGPRSSVDYLRRRKLLTPLSSSVATRWTFRDVVAVRTWRYLNAIARKRVSSAVVPGLSGFAGDPQAVRLGVMSNGNVHVDRGEGWENLVTGQGQFDMPITDIDKVFQPFTYGGGTVVSLLNASENTVLDPTILHGAPRLRGHRISAKALAEVYKRGGRDEILWAYPELEGSQFDDTVGIGLQILGTR